MGFDNITIPEQSIEFGDGKITVRGVSVPDLIVLVQTYGPQATMVFQKVQQGGSLQEKDVRLLLGSLIGEFSDMAAACIALAADSYDEATINTAKRLPMPVQVEVLEAIFTLTFYSEGELKKLMESLTRMLAGTSGVVKGMQLPLMSGIGGSAAA